MMAKQPLERTQVKGMLRDRASKGGWTLCCGAGVSKGAFPDWGGLAEALIVQAGVSGGAVHGLAEKLGSSFGWDAVLQAAQDKLGLSDKLFAEKLTSLLYEQMRSKCSPAEWREIARCLITKSPGGLQRHQWESFLKFIEKNYPSISALKIAETVAKNSTTDVAPRAIISFNAEPLLYALINAYTFRLWTGGPNTSPPHPINRLLRATSYSLSERSDYVFCHGLLPVPGTSGAESAIEKLVFRESEYLNLENSVFSWQASMFMNACLRTSLVFCGVSLSDPNMRRWLAWVQNNKIAELRARTYRSRRAIAMSGSVMSTSHLWLTKKPLDNVEAEWMASLVAHLGVRIVWLTDWAEMGSMLELMINS